MHCKFTSLFVFLGCLALPQTAVAQSDDCSSTTPITGLGAFPFSNQTATNSGLGCLGSVDVFWEWTVPATGDYLFELTFPNQIFDASLGLIEGSCTSGTLVGCNIAFASCGGLELKSAVAGQTYLVQVSGYGGATGSGELNVFESPCDPNFTSDDNFEDNDTVATAAPLSLGTHVGLFVSEEDPDFYSVVIPPFQAMHVRLINAPESHRTTTYSPSGIILSNGYTAANYNPQSPVPITVVVGIEVLGIGDTRARCGNYDLDFSYRLPFPEYSSFCFPTQANSVGGSAHLEAFRNAPQYGSKIVLNCNFGPPGQFGYYLVSGQSTSPGIPLGQGRFCLAGSFGRYNIAGTPMNAVGTFNQDGSFANSAGTGFFGYGFIPPATLPMGGMIGAGQTWSFQVWYREPMGNSNLSNGLSVTF